jgi:hypothetical protein
MDEVDDNYARRNGLPSALVKPMDAVPLHNLAD